MCGINGIIRKTSCSETEITATLTKMNNLIIHRGPDEDGFTANTEKDYGVGMAMRRLSIIDLSSGKQPIYSNDKKIVIVFNGEIYNYRSLKADLEAAGVKFKTTSDTEVILKLYEKYGVESFKWLDGMYGFSIFDKNINKVFIARDFFGEKPLYYTNNNKQFIWASELKSIINVLPVKPEISKKGLNLFLRLTYVPAPYSIYDNILKLEANHYIEYNLANHEISIKQIAQEIKPKEQSVPFDEAKKKIKDLVYESVESRSIADVPLGTFLSGGVDSSVVSLCLSQSTGKKIETFSIGFSEAKKDETDKSQLVAKMINSNHHEFKIGENDLKDNIHEILLNFDEPFSDTAALPTYFVSKKTKDYVKVALTGDGGDEVFGGYNKYYVGKMNSRYTNFVPKPIHNVLLKSSKFLLATKDDNRGRRFKIRKMLRAVDYKGNSYWDIISLANTEDELAEILNPNVYEDHLFGDYKEKLYNSKVESLTDFRHVDKILSLEGGMLAKVDRTSMQNSLECRAPFLNKKIWDYTNTLPEKYLMNGWNKKYILKEAFKDQFPEEFLEKSKMGFGSPVGNWLKSSLRKELEFYIEPQYLTAQGIFNLNKIIPLVKNHLDSKRDNTFRVWAFYCFQKWYSNIYLK
ncbi:asparagine synthase (glutamine-hydrolyzing) [Hyunsoonleella flava]|uniref:asparagine synthase (glutamine-hydrolyzing) n=1 Tax=Hyunsoonleella flava TaxID=2527939 RepID=A0A4Q9FGV6_9FLAO|nr:asparagine synthase (glutamine-hydrolyzing) [Hyunsoonleella flava]TBN06519.1 asparagine synthase (glutamine-hydrolyzing) [Hyunsoonleella flava]